MADLTKPSERRLKPVRLTDIPLEKRYAAAQQAAKRDPGFAEELLAAALKPSPTVYWVAA